MSGVPAAMDRSHVGHTGDGTALRIAHPLPLGFVGLAVASFAFGALQLGWISSSEGKTVALTVLFFTVPLQLLASVAGFLRAEVAAATGMAVLAGTWAAITLSTLSAEPGTTSKGLGVVLCAAAAAMLVPAAAGLAQPWAAAVMVAAGVRFAATAGYELTGTKGWQHAAGWVGLVAALLGYAVALLLAFGVLDGE
jgi:succinate-acetate transporter protein